MIHKADLYKGKYRIESTRLEEWDYSSGSGVAIKREGSWGTAFGYYFVTICTKNMECVLSRITDGKVVLTGIGNIAKRHWLEIPEHFKNVELNEFIIMPNHIHGIVIINNVETCHCMSLQKNSNVNKFSKPISGSLAMIINQYKSSVTRRCRKNRYTNFTWQSRFYDHIIRNEKSLQKIREYIHNNPLKWDIDENNPDFLEERRKNEVL